MRESCENIVSKLKEIEDEQEIENKVGNHLHNWGEILLRCLKDQLEAQGKIDVLSTSLHEVRQVTGARCLADGHSAAFLINTMNREEIKNKKMEAELASMEDQESGAEDDNARIDPPDEDGSKKGKFMKDSIYFKAIFFSST